MPSPLAPMLQQQCIFGSKKVAKKLLEDARGLMSTQDPADVTLALGLVDSALKLRPGWEKGLELKARSLLYLRRFKEVTDMLCNHLPSLRYRQQEQFADREIAQAKAKLGFQPNQDSPPLLIARSKAETQEEDTQWEFPKGFVLSKLNRKLLRASGAKQVRRRCEKDRWRCLVLGQACCHLGMMEDAMILLQSCRMAAMVSSRKESNGMQEDSFDCAELSPLPLSSTSNSSTGTPAAEAELVSTLLSGVKFLIRRRAAGMAALKAGHYMEAIRLFSKILDGGRRGKPQGFVAECYLHRALAYQGMDRVVDAIADCNRALALNPSYGEALRTRAALFEAAGCFSDCLQDLEQLKMAHEALLRGHLWSPVTRASNGLLAEQSPADLDLHLSLDHLHTKIKEAREKIVKHCPADYRMVLGLGRSCRHCRVDVERAFLLISLKHRPEKADRFIYRCELVDDRDIEAVKEEARSLSARLFRLIQKAYKEVLASVINEEKISKCQVNANANTNTNTPSSQEPAGVACSKNYRSSLQQGDCCNGSVNKAGASLAVEIRNSQPTTGGNATSSLVVLGMAMDSLQGDQKGMFDVGAAAAAATFCREFSSSGGFIAHKFSPTKPWIAAPNYRVPAIALRPMPVT